MNFAELGNLDPARIGSWPLPIRLLIFLAICVLLLAAGIYFDTRNQLDQLAKQESLEVELSQEFEIKQAKAANLDPLKALLTQMKQSLGEQLRLLPNRTEIEGLLVEISQARLASGLEFRAVQTGQGAAGRILRHSTDKDHGDRQLSRVWRIHQRGRRAATYRDPARNYHCPRKGKEGGTGDTLVMNTVAKTYRYMGEEEISSRQKAETERKAKRDARGKRRSNRQGMEIASYASSIR